MVVVTTCRAVSVCWAPDHFLKLSTGALEPACLGLKPNSNTYYLTNYLISLSLSFFTWKIGITPIHRIVMTIRYSRLSTALCTWHIRDDEEEDDKTHNYTALTLYPAFFQVLYIYSFNNHKNRIWQVLLFFKLCDWGDKLKRFAQRYMPVSDGVGIPIRSVWFQSLRWRALQTSILGASLSRKPLPHRWGLGLVSLFLPCSLIKACSVTETPFPT